MHIPNHCIFVHVPKTAGTSITNVLLKHGAHYDGFHTPASILRQQFDWGRHFSFSVIRNPWARAVSIYRSSRQTNRPFKDYLTGFRAPDPFGISYDISQSFYICENNTPIVNYICRLETIEADWRYVTQRIGIDDPLPHLNQRTTGDYRDYYDAEARDIVRRDHREDIERFGYSF